MKSLSIAEQTAKDFKEYLLDSFCYEFFEHLEGYEESTLENVADEIIKGIGVFHAELDREKMLQVIAASNDELEPPAYDDEDD